MSIPWSQLLFDLYALAKAERRKAKCIVLHFWKGNQMWIYYICGFVKASTEINDQGRPTGAEVPSRNHF